MCIDIVAPYTHIDRFEPIPAVLFTESGSVIGTTFSRASDALQPVCSLFDQDDWCYASGGCPPRA